MPEEGLASIVGMEAEVDLETEDLQEVIKGIDQDLMAEGVLVVQVRMVEEVLTGRDHMDMAVHLDTGQDHIAEEVLPGMEGLDQVEGVTRNHKLLLN